MEKKKDMTKELLANCFRELLETVPFEKITIKMITEKAGLIRPTFYKHFQDKYDLVEWIFRTEIADNVNLMINSSKEYDALLLLFRCMEKDRRFYKKLFLMEDSPNSFENILTRYLTATMGNFLIKHNATGSLEDAQVAIEMITAYHTHGIVQAIRQWIRKDNKISAESFYNVCQFILSHALTDLMEIDQDQ